MSIATRTGGIHDTNGPKNGIAWRTPAATVVTAAYSQAEDDVDHRR